MGTECQDADGGRAILAALRKTSGCFFSNVENLGLPFTGVALCQAQPGLLKKREFGSWGAELTLLRQ